MQKRGKCFIIQEPMKRDFSSRQMVPLMDFRKVLEYGDPVVCLPIGRMSLSPGPTVDILKTKLRNFCDDDYLVAVGDPSAIMMAGAIASEFNMGRFKMLKWDKESKQYIKVEVNLFNRTRKD